MLARSIRVDEKGMPFLSLSLSAGPCIDLDLDAMARSFSSGAGARAGLGSFLPLARVLALFGLRRGRVT